MKGYRMLPNRFRQLKLSMETQIRGTRLSMDQAKELAQIILDAVDRSHSPVCTCLECLPKRHAEVVNLVAQLSIDKMMADILGFVAVDHDDIVNAQVSPNESRRLTKRVQFGL